MSPRTKEQFEEIRKNRKEEILNAALHVFADEGYHSASIASLAKKANISKGLLYNYFESKEDVLRTLLVSFFEKNLELMEFTADHPHFTDDIMLNYIDNLFIVMDENRELWKLYFSLVLQPIVTKLAMEELYPKVVPFQQAMIVYFTKKFPDDPVGMMRYFHTIVDGMKMQYLYDPENYPLETIKKYITEQFIKR